MPSYYLPAIHDWADWGTLFTDVACWRTAVAALWADTPALADDPALGALVDPAAIDTMTAGYPGTCAVFLLGEKAVIKLFPPLVAGDWTRERAVYRLLAGRLPEMPRLLASGVWRDRIDWPYLVFSFCPGRAWREARGEMSPAQRLAVARALGQRVRVVHETPLAPGGEWPLPDAWPRFVAARLAEAPAALRAALPPAVAVPAEDLLRATDWFAARPCLLHADLTEDHPLVLEEGGAWRLSGLLDWADAEVGDPTYEWVALYFGFCGGDVALFRAFLAGYDSGAALPDRRLLAFTLLHRFGAHIIADRLPAEERRALPDLDALAARLFPGFDD